MIGLLSPELLAPSGHEIRTGQCGITFWIFGLRTAIGETGCGGGAGGGCGLVLGLDEKGVMPVYVRDSVKYFGGVGKICGVSGTFLGRSSILSLYST